MQCNIWFIYLEVNVSLSIKYYFKKTKLFHCVRKKLRWYMHLSQFLNKGWNICLVIYSVRHNVTYANKNIIKSICHWRFLTWWSEIMILHQSLWLKIVTRKLFLHIATFCLPPQNFTCFCILYTTCEKLTHVHVCPSAWK